MFTGEIEWSSSPVTFHENKGSRVRLTEGKQVANNVYTKARQRVKWASTYTIVFTAEPLSVGQLFKVTVKSTKIPKKARWIDGLDIGFTGDDPKCRFARWPTQNKRLIHTSSRTLHFNDKRLCELGFDTVDFKPGQSLGLLLTRDRECHWFLDDEWRGSVQMRDFPLDQPMWGVVDVYGQCKQVRADICSVSKCPPDTERKLIEMGLIAKPLLVQRLQETYSALQEQLTQATQELSQTNSNCQQLQQETSCERERAAAEIQQLTQSRQQLAQSIEKLTEYLPLLTQSHRQLQRADAENQQLVATLREQIDKLQQRVGSSP